MISLQVNFFSGNIIQLVDVKYLHVTGNIRHVSIFQCDNNITN